MRLDELLNILSTKELYITKLVSLILFRLVYDDNVEEFHLDADIDYTHYSYICFKVKIKALARPIIVILHISYIDPTTEQSRPSVLNEVHDLTYITAWPLQESLKKCGGKFEKLDYLHVFFTTARINIDVTKVNPYRGVFADHLNALIATDDNRQGVQLDCAEDQLKDAHEIYLDSEMKRLAYHFLDFLSGQSTHMQHVFIVRYHALLARKVVHISDIQTQGLVRYRELTFRREFFITSDKYLMKLRDELGVVCANIFTEPRTSKNNSMTSSTVGCDETTEKQISEFLSHPSATTLTPLMEKRIISGYHILKFNIKRPTNDLSKLDLINSKTRRNEVRTMAVEAGKHVLMSLKLKVPVTFGNVDLVLTHKSLKRNRRLKFLTQSIVKLCQTSIASGEHNLVTIDETEGRRFLSVEAGIGSTIGNLFVYDEATELLKFTDNFKSLQDNARVLYDKLKSSSITDSLNSYRFNAKTVKNFPKLELDSIEDYKAYLNKHCVIYERQSDHNEVENILKEEIARQFTDEQKVSVLSEKIFMYCHSAVQEWEMPEHKDHHSKKKRRCLTKSSDVYRNDYSS